VIGGLLLVVKRCTYFALQVWEFKNTCIPRFLSSFNECQVRTLADIVQYNMDHKDECLPPRMRIFSLRHRLSQPGLTRVSAHTEQDDLIKALNNSDDAPHIEKLKTGLRTTARRILDGAFNANGLNVIAAPADSSLCVHAAAAGYPIATVPLGQLRYNDRPFGLCLVSRAGDEEVLLQFMFVWSKLVRRPMPDLGMVR
jgi:amidase